MNKRLIVTVEGLGSDTETNQAIEKLVTNGLVTSVTVDLSGSAIADALERIEVFKDTSLGLQICWTMEHALTNWRETSSYTLEPPFLRENRYFYP